MKRKKVLAALTSLGVTASMMALGGAASATTQDYTPSLPNPTLEAQCGLDFGLVLDSSGSIGNTGIQDLKDATDAFVDALVDTGSRSPSPASPRAAREAAVPISARPPSPVRTWQASRPPTQA